MIRPGFWPSTKGNIFGMLFGAVALVGVIGGGISQIISGPIRTAHMITATTNTDADLLTNANMIGLWIKQQGTDADSDSDGYVEPLEPSSCDTAPAGGGCLPTTIGAIRTDTWGTKYGYCVWDHGETTGSTGRLEGTTTTAGPLIVVISAGQDKIFQTSCHGYTEAGIDPEDIDTIIQPKASGGGDDRVRMFTYDMAAASAYIEELPDEACTEETTGLMRYDMETLQICNGDEWQEVSGSGLSASGSFNPVTDADLSTSYTSNAIIFEGFLGTREATVTNGATIVVNGMARGSSTTITSGDSVQLRATSAGVPETLDLYELSISAIRRQWSITTRDRTPPNLTITPSSESGLDVIGPGDPAYGDNATFIVRNTGESTTGVLGASVLSNAANFEFHDVADGCHGAVLAHDDTCFIEVRAKASSSGPYNGTVSTAGPVAVASLSGTASGWACTLPWGGELDDGDDVTAYQTGSVPFESTCVSETRTCGDGTLSGSYGFQSCAPQAPTNCTLPWGGAIGHNSSVTAYASASVPFGSSCVSETRTCSNGSLSGTFHNQNCSVSAASGCSLPWGGSINHGNSVIAYQNAAVPFGSACDSQTRTCDDGSLSGSFSFESCTVASPSSCSLPWGGTISHGDNVTAYEYGDQSCGNTQTRTCTDGTLSGSYTNESCDSGHGYCWGENNNGNLGTGNMNEELVPTAVIPDRSWATISAGWDHTCGITTSGDAYCWGNQSKGRLGNGNDNSGSIAVPAPVSGGHSWTQISAGDEHSCGVTTSGDGYCWGDDNDGRLGNGAGTFDVLVPTAVSGGHSWATISAGLNHSCGVTTSGDAYCWGNGLTGAIGNGDDDDESVPTAVSGGHSWAAISAGGQYTCGVTTSGDGYCWGQGGDGKLGSGTMNDASVPTAVSGSRSWATISAGWDHTCGITTSGHAYCWGNGMNGKLGYGNTFRRVTPTPVSGGYSWATISAGEEHTCGVTTSGDAYCWGNGMNGKLGHGGTYGASVPTAVSGGHSWATISAGEEYTCGVTN